VIPVYRNYYFTENLDRGYLSLGADVIQVTQAGNSNDTFQNNGVAAVVGAGYESRNKEGFLLRLGLYFIVGTSVMLSPSVSLGFAS
jgi:hypothetical protein